ncbi:MAG TPA: hypothetical protein VE439_02165 [Anaerolineae bacterium]|nr:hypothetical protein [Anaerolineae bacterium]
MDQASYFRNNPPRCIAGFIVRPTELPLAEFDGHVSISQIKTDVPAGVTIHAPEHFNPIFALFCECGGSRHYVHGYRWTNPDFHNAVVFLSPLVLECAVCGKETDLLDTDVHGYDAELGNGAATVRAKGDRVAYECANCGRQPFDIFVRFEYPDDLFDSDSPEFAGREQDLFTWFSLVGKCPQCSQMLDVADFECA